LCAAPGGKTTFIGELMNNTGEILAVDRYETRINLVHTACKRLGITNVQTLAEDGSTIVLPPADKVLVDAPCSGLGVIAKKPDAKWLRESDDLIRLANLQQRLLENAATLVKPGGVVVYSTCTIEPDENFDIIRAFLGSHPDFSIEPATAWVQKDLVSERGAVETFRHKHGMDGAFSIRLKKQQ
jgi:16S rRNA (cytosine967-C5)-methyltransferase